MKQIRLNAVLPAYAAAADGENELPSIIQFAKAAEKAKADALFMADTAAGFLGGALRRPWHGQDPVALLSALAVLTDRIGLVATMPANSGHPFTVARQIATLQQLSAGRAGWNVTTVHPDPIQRQLGVDPYYPAGSDQYKVADEFMTVVTELWRSLPENAIIRGSFGENSLDFQAVCPVENSGEYYESFGVLPIAGSYDGALPAVFHAGASKQSLEFAARWSNVFFTAVRDQASAIQTRQDLRSSAASNGRNPDEVLLLPGLSLIVGATMAEAEKLRAERLERRSEQVLLQRLSNRLAIPAESLVLDAELPYQLLQMPAPNGLVSSYRKFAAARAKANGYTVREFIASGEPNRHGGLAGTPESIAEHIVHWVDSGAADGFNLVFGESVDDVTELSFAVFDELRARGRYRDDYDSASFRQNFGLE